MHPTDLAVHNVEWSQEKVNSFWKALRGTALNGLSFSEMMHPVLVSLIKAACPPPARVLDYGAGNGVLANILRQDGYTVTDFDPGKSSLDISSGLSPAAEPQRTGPTPDANYDLIVSFEVLEHILPEQWDETFVLLKKLLAPNGVFIGSVPADETLAENMCLCPDCGAFFHRFQHQHSFSQARLENIFKIQGFLHTFITWIPFSYYFYASPLRPVPRDLPDDWGVTRDLYNVQQKNLSFCQDRIVELERELAPIPPDIIDFFGKEGKIPRLGKKIIRLLQRMHDYKNTKFKHH